MVDVEELAKSIDIFFLIINGIIIYFMQCGFAFLECGAVRSKNATNILIKNILDSFVAGIAYWIFGYAFAFGRGNFFIGHSFFASHNLDSGMMAHWFFQFVFAATAATIVSGAVAERCEFAAYLTYSIFITGFVYPVVTHWAWSAEGWLAVGYTFQHQGTNHTIVFQDFAGSGVVHLFGGVVALVACGIIGPRVDRFTEEGRAIDMPGHSVPLAALGGFILYFGFFAFNGGSQLSISKPGDGATVAVACANTIISGSFGAFVAMVTSMLTSFVRGKGVSWSCLTTINGGLAGMVAICAGCNTVYPWGAAIIGAIAGWTYLAWNALLLKLRFDDPLEAVAVHAGGGFWGVVAAPILARDTGIVFRIQSLQAWMGLAWNIAGTVAIIAWSATISLVLFGLLKAFGILRVPREMEEKGLDVPKHGEPAYPMQSYGDGWARRQQAEVKSSLSSGTETRMRAVRSNPRKNYDRSNGGVSWHQAVHNHNHNSYRNPGYKNTYL